MSAHTEIVVFHHARSIQKLLLCDAAMSSTTMLMVHAQGCEFQAMLVNQNACLRAVANTAVIAYTSLSLESPWFINLQLESVCKVFEKIKTRTRDLILFRLQLDSKNKRILYYDAFVIFFDRPLPGALSNLPMAQLDALKELVDKPAITSTPAPPKRKKTAAQARRSKEQAETEALCKPAVSEWLSPLASPTAASEGKRAGKSGIEKEKKGPVSLRVANTFDEHSVFIDYAAEFMNQGGDLAIPQYHVQGFPAAELYNIFWETSILLSDYTGFCFDKDSVMFRCRGEIGTLSYRVTMHHSTRPDTTQQADSQNHDDRSTNGYSALKVAPVAKINRTSARKHLPNLTQSKTVTKVAHVATPATASVSCMAKQMHVVKDIITTQSASTMQKNSTLTSAGTSSSCAVATSQKHKPKTQTKETSDRKASDRKPSDGKSSDSKSSDSKPSDSKPSDSKPGDRKTRVRKTTDKATAPLKNSRTQGRRSSSSEQHEMSAASSVANGVAKAATRSVSTKVGEKRKRREASNANAASMPFTIQCSRPQQARPFEHYAINRCLLFTVPMLRLATHAEILATEGQPLIVRCWILGHAGKADLGSKIVSRKVNHQGTDAAIRVEMILSPLKETTSLRTC